MLEALLLLIGTAIGGASITDQIHGSVQAGKGAVKTALIKEALDRKLKQTAENLMENRQLAEKLYTIYQQRGADVARSYLMQSPFGANIRILRQELNKVIKDFSNMNEALTKDRTETEQLESKYQNWKNSLSGTEQDALVIGKQFEKDERHNQNFIKPEHIHNKIQIGQYLDRLNKQQDTTSTNKDTNLNKPKTPSLAASTTSPATQVQGGLPVTKPIVKTAKISQSQIQGR